MGIAEYREHMREHIPQRVCPVKYGEREVLVASKAPEGSSLGRLADANRKGKRKACHKERGGMSEPGEDGVQITGTIERRGGPRIADKLNQWGLAESTKRGDGNCYFYNIGEAMGLFYGYEDERFSIGLRKRVSEVLTKGSRLGEKGEPDGMYRDMTKGKATEPWEVHML
jgi:hypothetical protein